MKDQKKVRETDPPQTKTNMNRHKPAEINRDPQNFPVLPHTGKLAQITSQYYFDYFVLPSLHKVPPRATSYHKACTNYLPVLLRTESLREVLPSSTPYYKTCTKFAQSTSQHYFVQQSLHKTLPSTTSYHKFCTPLFRATKFAQKYFAVPFVLQSLHKGLPSTTSYHFAIQSFHKVLPTTTS